MTSFALFDTALGVCGIAWTEAGIRRVLLPDESPERLRERFEGNRFAAVEATPPVPVQAVIDGVIRLFDGADERFENLQLDESAVPAFNRQVYAIARSIRPGSTLTYGEIATRLGQPGSSRAVGRALGDNPFPIVVPCHRVLAADGSMHGFSAPGGVGTKRRMLQIEGALAPDEPTLF